MTIRTNTISPLQPTKPIWQKDLMKENLFELLTHNKCVYADKNAPPNELSNEWHFTLEEAAQDIGMMQYQKMQRESHFPQKRSQLLKEARKAKAKYITLYKKASSLKHLVHRANIAGECKIRSTVTIKNTRNKNNRRRSHKRYTYYKHMEWSIITPIYRTF